MKKYIIEVLLLMLAMAACKSKKKEPEKKFVSVLSIIKSQVAHVDTSLYAIVKIVITDSLHSDTTDMPREDFQKAAKDFLSVPDLSDKKIAERYKEETIFDETINRAIITYTPQDPAREEIQKQEVLFTPDVANSNNVNNIIMNTIIANRDSSIQKNMLWRIDESFQVVTTLQKPGKPVTITTLKVIWK
jgi:hypothetical protein